MTRKPNAAKIAQTLRIAEYKGKLSTNAQWAEAAILALYARQTSTEQSDKQTKENNAKGFTGVDAEILSSFAEQIARSTRAKGDRLSPKQLAIAFKKLPKYAGQLTLVADEKLAARCPGLSVIAAANVGVHQDIVDGNAFGALERKQEEAAYLKEMEVEFK